MILNFSNLLLYCTFALESIKTIKMRLSKILSIALSTLFTLSILSCGDDEPGGDNGGGSGNGGGNTQKNKLKPVHINMMKNISDNTFDLWLSYHPTDTMRLVSYTIKESYPAGNFTTTEYQIIYARDNATRIDSLFVTENGNTTKYNYLYAATTNGTAIVKRLAETVISMTTVSGRGDAWIYNSSPKDPQTDLINYYYSNSNISKITYEGKSGHAHEGEHTDIHKEYILTYKENNGVFKSVSSASDSKATPQWFLTTELGDYTYGQLYNNASVIKIKQYKTDENGKIIIEENKLSDVIYSSFQKDYPTRYENKYSEVEKDVFNIEYNKPE